MRWTKPDYRRWRRVFLIFPQTIDGNTVWLETVWRRPLSVMERERGMGSGYGDFWLYALDLNVHKAEALAALSAGTVEPEPVAWAIFWRYATTFHATYEDAKTALQGASHDIVPLYAALSSPRPSDTPA